MKKEQFLKQYNISENQFCGKEEIGGGLDLRSLTSIPEGFNPTVGGGLDLRSLTSIPEGFNPTVGGGLDLRSLTSIPEGFNPTVGGGLYLRRGLTAPTKPYIAADHKPKPLIWKNGKFIMADGIFTEVLMHRGNVWHVKKLNVAKSFYLVTDGEGNYSHGDTLKKAKEDLLFKIQSETFKKEPINADTVININHYRLITGACEAGVKNWMQSVFDYDKLAKVYKNGIKAKDLLPLLEKSNAFGLREFKALITW